MTAVADATAQAARRAQLYRERRDVAHTLQAAMLPELPALPGLQLASRYLPWSPTDEQVGGDWYDAIALPDGGVLLLIGDVAGHDIEAAARMGRVRSMFRALAVDHPEEHPAALVHRLDHVLDALGDLTLATMAVVRLDPPGPGRQVHWTTAGHPPPLLVDAQGHSTVLLADPDLPLGVAPGRPRHDHVREWPAGATLVLYTDGLVERRGRDVGDGILVLRSSLERTHTEPLETLLGELVTAHVANSEDDCAVLACATPLTGSPSGAAVPGSGVGGREARAVAGAEAFAQRRPGGGGGAVRPRRASSGTRWSTTSAKVPGIVAYMRLNPSTSASSAKASSSSATVCGEPASTGPRPPTATNCARSSTVQSRSGSSVKLRSAERFASVVTCCSRSPGAAPARSTPVQPPNRASAPSRLACSRRSASRAWASASELRTTGVRPAYTATDRGHARPPPPCGAASPPNGGRSRRSGR